MPWRAFLGTLIACYVAMVLLIAAIRMIDGPERNPLLIDARSPLDCPAIHTEPFLTRPIHNYDYRVGNPPREGGIV